MVILASGNFFGKNLFLLTKWLWTFPLGMNSSWHQVFKSKFGLPLNGWDKKVNVLNTYKSSWKVISSKYASSLF